MTSTNKNQPMLIVSNPRTSNINGSHLSFGSPNQPNRYDANPNHKLEQNKHLSPNNPNKQNNIFENSSNQPNKVSTNEPIRNSEIKPYQEKNNISNPQNNYNIVQEKKINQNSNDPDQGTENSYPCLFYLISWVIFILAVVTYMIVFVINKYACDFAQTSFYYFSDYSVSSYFYNDADATTMSSAKTIKNAAKMKQALSISMTLLYTWIMYKFPLVVHVYGLVQYQQLIPVRIVLAAIVFVILFITDILIFVFFYEYYQEYMFYAYYCFLATIVSFISLFNRFTIQNFLSVLKSVIFPFFLFPFYYTCFNYLIPALLKAQVDGLGAIKAAFLFAYLYPFIDLILYTLLLVANYFVGKQGKHLLGFFHFYLIGYGVGIIMNANYTEVQFYYLTGYFIFRNVFVNWVVYKFEGVVNNPPCLPGWILIYYLSYMLNFVPIIGIGRLVISNGYFSRIFSKTYTILFPITNPAHPSTTYSDNQLNFYFEGRIFWAAALIIWVAMTVTQQYPRRKPTIKDFSYCMLGIFMFYQGIASSLNLNMLRTASIP